MKRPDANSRRRRSPTGPSVVLAATAVAVLLCVSLVVRDVLRLSTASAQVTDEMCPGSASAGHRYDFERWNYYELLGLEDPSVRSDERQKQKQRKTYRLADIKRAFRKQSQLHHPDKLRAKNTTTTVQESNARFAKIAEAYEVLRGNDKKHNYDELLRLCEQYRRSHTPVTDEASSFVSRFATFLQQFSTDPRQVFEEFFFGTTVADDDDDLYTDPQRQRQCQQQQRQQQRQQQQQQQGRTVPNSWQEHPRKTSPVRSYESQEVMYDPYTGQELVRLLQTEEFEPDPTGCFRFRIIAQEFAVELDRRKNDKILHPITDLYLLDEGYRCHRPSHESNSRYKDYLHNSRFQQGRRRRKRRRGSDSLYPGDNLTNGQTKLLTSANGRYTAGISEDCELLITTENSVVDDRGERIVWSSDTYIPHGQCFVTFHREQPSHLLVVLGTLQRPRQILWYSEGSPEENDNVHFFARLDNDGALTVYQIRLVPLHQAQTQQPQWIASVSQWLGSGPPQTNTARAWVKVRNAIADTIFRWDYASVPNYVTISKCVSTTSPAGCNRPVRRLLQLGKDALFVGRQVFYTIDKLVDEVFEMFDADNDNGDSPVDAILRHANNAARRTSSWIRARAQRGLEAVKNLEHKARRQMRRDR